VDRAGALKSARLGLAERYRDRVNDAERVDVGELRQHASRYVEMVKAGQRVPVTEEGEVIAYLVPAHEMGTVLDRMRAAGQVRAARGNLMDLLPPPPAPPAAKSLTETLLEMRDEERY
jgi:antitoxin (DNA-binding transcriptional repressor) of toxin-antitoxin stability system